WILQARSQRRAALERVRLRGFRVRAEARRADHQHARGGLRLGGRGLDSALLAAGHGTPILRRERGVPFGWPLPERRIFFPLPARCLHVLAAAPEPESRCRVGEAHTPAARRTRL